MDVSREQAKLTIAGDVVFVGLGGLKGGCSANELVRPLGFVWALLDLLVGLGLFGVVWGGVSFLDEWMGGFNLHVSVCRWDAELGKRVLSNQPIVLACRGE